MEKHKTDISYSSLINISKLMVYKFLYPKRVNKIVPVDLDKSGDGIMGKEDLIEIMILG